jgi:phage tail sheath protein FI
MAVQVSYPGVYIEEFAPAPPIQGVSTSNAAFIGVASGGDLDDPTKITSWDQFKQRFGEQPVPGFFLWYAVRGFFENNGQVCYIVRASDGAYDEATLNDRVQPNSNPVIRVRARQPGANTTNPIQVQVSDAHLVPNTTTLFQPVGVLAAPAAVGDRTITLAAGQGVPPTPMPTPTPPPAGPGVRVAISFKPDDYITIAAGQGVPPTPMPTPTPPPAGGERIRVVGVTGDTLRLASGLTNAYNVGDTVRLADAPPGTRAIRIRPNTALPIGALVPGTVLTVIQGANSDSQVVESVQTEPVGGGLPTYRVNFRQGLSIALSYDPANAATVESQEFNFIVTQGGAPAAYNNLAMDPAHPRYFANIINRDDVLVRVEPVDPPPPVAPPNNLPAAGGPVSLSNGRDEDLSVLAGPNGDQHFIDALETLREIDDVNIIAIPDRITVPVQQALIAHCEQLADRFAVLDAELPVPNQELFGPGSIEEQRRAVDSTRGYAALYYPWLRVARAGTGAPILVPPSGHVCGIMARSDNSRGVHKAPANEIVNGALDVERTMSDVDQGLLNLQGINVIRLFQTGGRPMLWGARTTATDLNWQYVNVRRLFLFIEESIQEGIRFAIFEPNNLQLWQKLKRSITAFLTRVWRDGALFGAKAEDAFYVRIDEVLNPFSEQALGRLNLEIGLRPTYPAEFIIVRIGIFQGGSEVTEV